jgi:hypothetical protein
MGNATDTRFSIIREGEFKEEVREWSEIETMSRAGRLSPNTLIFMPGENAWKKLGDTSLADCLEKAARADVPGDSSAKEAAAKAEEDDESLLEEIRSNPNDIGVILKAAEAAVARGNPDAARGYYQKALEVSPYHPRVAQEAKRKLPVSKWKSLRFLEKPPQVWEDPVAVFAYPLLRGPLYLALLAVVLAGLFWTPWTAAISLIAASLWAMETARAASLAEARPPLWHGLVADPIGRIVKPALVTMVVAAELSALFVAVAGILLVTGLSAESDVFAVIQKSPVMTVLLCTLLLAYFPAVIALAGGSRLRALDICDPRRIVSAIRMMEVEYLIAVAVIAALLCAMWGVGALVRAVPLLERAFYAVATVYVVLFGGFVLGKLCARFRDRLEAPAEGASLAE